MSDWTLTGNTRYAMRGWFFRRAALQVEETRMHSHTDWQTFDTRSWEGRRWRFANQADLLNLGIAGQGTRYAAIKEARRVIEEAKGDE